MKYSTLSALLAFAATTTTASPVDAYDPVLFKQAIEYDLAKRNAEAIGHNRVNFDKAPSLIEPWWNLPHMIIGQQKGNNKRNAIAAQNNLPFQPTIGIPEDWWPKPCPKGTIWTKEAWGCVSPQQNQGEKRNAEAAAVAAQIVHLLQRREFDGTGSPSLIAPWLRGSWPLNNINGMAGSRE